MEIRNYISELLSEHDCVIIPGLGGFIGSYLPAQIHPVYHTFQPPSKKFLFNINLRQNDGLLANRISQVEQLPFQEANERIRKFVEEGSKILKTRKHLIIPNVGKLFMGKEGNLIFEQDLRSNLLIESYGLQPFFSSPIRRDGANGKLEKRKQFHKESEEVIKRHLPKPVKWAAILALPVATAVFLSMARYDTLNSGNWNHADFLSSIVNRLSPFSSSQKRSVSDSPSSVYREEIPETDLSEPVGQNTYQEEVSKPVESKRIMTEYQSLHPDQTASVAVIVGAFRIKSNAQQLVNALNQEGLQAQIVDRSSGGLYRVAAGVFSNHKDAENLMQKLKSGNFPEAWILAK